MAIFASKLAPTGVVFLQVQRVAQRPQRRFLHRFTQGRVGVDGAGHVFQACAHFQAQAERGRQLGYPSPTACQPTIR